MYQIVDADLLCFRRASANTAIFFCKRHYYVGDVLFTAYHPELKPFENPVENSLI